MMGDVVSLKLARKQKQRAAKDEAAAENRAKFGQTKAEKQLRKLEDARATREHDGKKRDP